jgi:hypothetical protein
MVYDMRRGSGAAVRRKERKINAECIRLHAECLSSAYATKQHARCAEAAAMGMHIERKKERKITLQAHIHICMQHNPPLPANDGTAVGATCCGDSDKRFRC